METFRVVFSGEVLPDQDRNKVAKRFAAAFNLRDSNALRRLFSGKVVTLKKGLSHEHAQRYRTILMDMGAQCCIEKEFNPLFQPLGQEFTERKSPRPSLFSKVDPNALTVTPKEHDRPSRHNATFI